MFFSSIKGVNRLRSEGMSNIYLKVTIEKKLCSQKFDFLNLKNADSRRYHLILKLN